MNADDMMTMQPSGELRRCMALDPSAQCLQLATVECGHPRNRTVLLEGVRFSDFDKTNSRVVVCFKASNRSSKVVHADNDCIEICWWFPRAGVQWRVAGTVEYIENTHSGEKFRMRQQCWKHLNRAAQSMFFHSGKVEATNSFASQDEAFKSYLQSKEAQIPPVSFAFGAVAANELDFLDLNTCSRKTWKWNASDGMYALVHDGFAPPTVSTLVAAKD